MAWSSYDLTSLWASLLHSIFQSFSRATSLSITFSLDPSNFLLSVLPRHTHTEIESLRNPITSKFFSSQYHQKCNNGRLTIWSKCVILLHRSIFTFPPKAQGCSYFPVLTSKLMTQRCYFKKNSKPPRVIALSLWPILCGAQLLIIPDPVWPKQKSKKPKSNLFTQLLTGWLAASGPTEWPLSPATLTRLFAKPAVNGHFCINRRSNWPPLHYGN